MQPDAPGDGRKFLKLCGLFVVTLALRHTDPHVGGVKQTKIIIFYEEPERYQMSEVKYGLALYEKLIFFPTMTG